LYRVADAGPGVDLSFSVLIFKSIYRSGDDTIDPEEFANGVGRAGRAQARRCRDAPHPTHRLVSEADSHVQRCARGGPRRTLAPSEFPYLHIALAATKTLAPILRPLITILCEAA
jgi:hypothetical protein